MTTQQVASVARQIVAVLAVAVALTSQYATVLHLPQGVASALVVIGGGLLWIEHHDSNLAAAATPPSIGTPAPPAPPVA